LLAAGGSFCISWKPERMPDLEKGLKGRDLRLTARRDVLSRSDEKPFIILCRGIRGGQGPGEPEIMEPLTIFESNRYTPEAYNILVREGPPASSL